MTDPTKHHPAQWSEPILAAIAPFLADLGMPVFDPFAGTGVRLGRLCDELGLPFSGTEIVADFIVDQRVQQGDSTLPEAYPWNRELTICTSPVYPSGVADHFHARDASKRHTYRQALHSILGHDEPLDDRNMGRWSVRQGKRAWEKYRNLAVEATTWWRWPAIVNVKDFWVGQDCFPLAAHWKTFLENRHYTVGSFSVSCPGNRHGANGQRRVDHETVLVAIPESWNRPLKHQEVQP